MSRGFNIRMTGFDQFIKKMQNADKNLANAIDQELDTAAINVQNTAKMLAPRGKSGKLASSIGVNLSERGRKSIFARVPYAPFVEFGTGANVFDTPEFEFTPEMKAFAMEFYVSGRGMLYPQPFLFPALMAEKPKLLERIKKRMFSEEVLW